jgi:(4S)-4-hydroxy-5-phosphonooxypentane-2,3-dione isomerase
MYVVTVEFTVKPQHREAFMQAMAANAHASLAREKGCTQFDVCTSEQDPCHVFLYEIYQSKEDFQAHLATPHFAEFNQNTGMWIDKKLVQTMLRVYPHTS